MLWLFSDSSRLRAWACMLGSTALILAGGLSPPLLPAPARAMIRNVFAPVCHQIVSRSPHIAGMPIAICDRCTGIYVGLVLGVATVGWGRHLWSRVQGADRFVLVGSLLPLGVDWMGPILGLWANSPLSRSVTGLIFGVIAASFMARQVLQRRNRR